MLVAIQAEEKDFISCQNFAWSQGIGSVISFIKSFIVAALN